MRPHSFHAPDYLRYCTPGWVRELADGTRVAGWGLLLIASATVAGEAAGPGPASAFCQWAAAAGGTCLFYGAWRLSRGNGKAPTRRTDVLVCWLLRALLAAGVTGALLRASTSSGVSVEAVPAVSLALHAGVAADVAAQMLLLWHLRRVALRIPDGSLAKRITAFLPVYALAVSTAAALRLLPPAVAAEPLGVAGALALAVATLQLFRHLRRLRRGLDIQTDYARGLSSRFVPAAA